MSDERAPPSVRNLDPRLVTNSAAQILSKVPWEGPRLDPSKFDARSMLAWLR